MSQHIAHITLATGHVSRIYPGDVTGETLARLAPWIDALIETGQPLALPVSVLADYTGLASVFDGALLLTISGPSLKSGAMAGKCPPLISVGVARKSRHDHLWGLITSAGMPPYASGVVKPQSPWCGVVIYPTVAMYPESLEWLGDLQRSIAWSWCSKSSA